MNIHEIKKEKGMKVPGKIFASEKILKKIQKDKTYDQIKNVAKLPGIVGSSIALPDAHQGYGFCIGGVAAFDLKKGIVCPGGIGYDINCGIRLLRTNLDKKNFMKKREKVSKALAKKIPSGVGHGSPFQLSRKKLNQVLEKGAKFMVEEGYGREEDLLNIEEKGCMEGGNPDLVSDRAKKRGIGQLGTLGAGNHFLDVLFVEEIFDKKAAKVFGLKKDQIVLMIHCGSRGLGHQIASDYIQKMEEKYGFDKLPDRELASAPIKSKLGKEYLSAMACATNFAFANRQLITHWIREELENWFSGISVEVLYEVCHNIAKFEKYKVEGKKVELCVHRKGATRSFGPGRLEIPKHYLKIGQPVLIPGSMGTASYVMKGSRKSEDLSFGSSVHGAGRVMSRSKALRDFDSKNIVKKLDKVKVKVYSDSDKSLIQEAPAVYKDIEDVVGVVDEIGLSEKVAKLRPISVIIG